MTALETLYLEYQRGACKWCRRECSLLEDEGEKFHLAGGQKPTCAALDFAVWADQYVATLQRQKAELLRELNGLDMYRVNRQRLAQTQDECWATPLEREVLDLIAKYGGPV